MFRIARWTTVLIASVFALALVTPNLFGMQVTDTTPTTIDTSVVADSSAVLSPTLPSAEELTGWLYTAIFVVGLPWLIVWAEARWPFLRAQSAMVKRTVVFIAPAVLTLALKYLAARWPWLPIDLEYWNALVVSVGAFAIHGNNQAKEAKASTSDRGD